MQINACRFDTKTMHLNNFWINVNETVGFFVVVGGAANIVRLWKMLIIIFICHLVN